MSLFGWFVSWVINGLSFIAVVGYIAYAYGINYVSVPVGDADPFKQQKAEIEEQHRKSLEAEKNQEGVDLSHKPLAGWLTIRRQFKPSSAGMAPAFSSHPPSEALAGIDAAADETDRDLDGGDATSSLTNTSTNTYSARLAQTYRSMVEARAKTQAPPKDFYYCVIKGPVLFVYEDETSNNCLAALSINSHTVRVERDDGRRFKGKDSEMFGKRNAIVMRPSKKGSKDGLPVISKSMKADAGEDKSSGAKPIFLFSKSNMKMEDWYLALIQASAQEPTFDQVFNVGDMRTLVDTIDTEPDPIPMRWFNAMLGRIFFALYKTEALEQFIIGKIMKKLTRVNRPGFLGPIVVREVNVGSIAPFFSKPMLKNLTVDGEASFEAHMRYNSQTARPDSQVRITIATTATIPTGFKPYVVDLVLAVVLKSFEGNLIMQMKKPPSNRIWYGFTHMPKMDIEIIPIVSERKIQLGMVLNAIEKQMREVIAESVVAPNMDDIAFFDTSKLQVRGGLFSEAGKVKRDHNGVEEDRAESPEPSMEIETANEDPSSAVPETASLRKRNPVKSNTIQVGGAEATATSEAGPGMPRTETAPPGTGPATSVKKAVAIQATKRWFAPSSTSRSPSLSSQTVTGTPRNASDTMLAQTRSRSSERGAPFAEEPHAIDPNFGNSPEVAAIQVSSSTAGLVHNDNASVQSRKSSDSGRTSGTHGEIDIHTLSANPKSAERSVSSSSSTLPSGSAASQAAPSQPGSATSLISSFRARDKKAIQAQAQSAKENLKKWGVGFAAKHRGGGNAAQEQEVHRPAALYRPPEEDAREDHSSGMATSPGRSLQDRLNAAAHSGASPLPIPARERSSSSSSRPSLFTSPGKGAVSPASTSPPKWVPSTSKTTTSVMKNENALGGTPPVPSGSAALHTRRESNSAPVFMQPAPGRSMVVPRVPKRPGQVTGIGHRADEPMIRRVSTEDGLKEERIEDVNDHKSENQPRSSELQGITAAQEHKPSSQAAHLQGGVIQGPQDIPSPARPASPSQKGDVPPPLPPRTTSPTPSTSSASISKPVTPLPPPPGDLQRSDSMPTPASRHTVRSGSGSDTGPPVAEVVSRPAPDTPDINLLSSPRGEIDTALAVNGKEDSGLKSAATSSTAEIALRQLVARSEAAQPSKGRQVSGSQAQAREQGVANDGSAGEGPENAEDDGVAEETINPNEGNKGEIEFA